MHDETKKLPKTVKSTLLRLQTRTLRIRENADFTQPLTQDETIIQVFGHTFLRAY